MRELRAVIEVLDVAPDFVRGLPERPWPTWIRLSADTDDAALSLVVSVLAQYGHSESRPTDLAGLVCSFPRVAPGGLAPFDEAVSILPSCCCGLECWRDWWALLETGASPWLGHDPSPWVEIAGDRFIVWSDGGMGGPPTGPSIEFTRDELVFALQNAERDLNAFVDRLARWSGADPAIAGGLAQRFTEVFVWRTARR